MQARQAPPAFRWTRRNVLVLGLSGLASAIASPASAVPPRAAPALPPTRRIRLVNPHSGERVDTVYWADGDYVAEAMKEIDYLLRDHRLEEVHRTDPKLIDVLSRLQARLDLKKPFQVICGYRSPATNETLVRTGAAKHSFHMYGQAVDVRIEGASLKDVFNAAVSLRGGGVGRYPRARYVHIDTGPVRTW